MTTQSILIELIANVICGKPTSFNELSDEKLEKVHTFAKKHDLSQFIGAALAKKEIAVSKTAFQYYQNVMFTTVVRMQKISYEYDRACEALENAGIQFVPLKGAVIKNYYPEFWLRTSCDIDILVHKNDLEKAIAAINSNNRFQVSKKHYHDVSLMTADGIHIELHFSILEANSNLDAVLKDVWAYTEPQENHKFLMRLTPEFFLFHIYAHTTYHFFKGGCGIKTIIDIFLLENNLQYNNDSLEVLLKKAKIKQFRQELKALSNVWFSNASHSEITPSIEKYIFSGGVYGSRKNSIMVRSTDQLYSRYVLRRIFVPYNILCSAYPILNKHKYLTPVFEVVRWVRFLFKGDYKAKINEVETFNSLSYNEQQEVDTMLKNLGLREEE